MKGENIAKGLGYGALSGGLSALAAVAISDTFGPMIHSAAGGPEVEASIRSTLENAIEQTGSDFTALSALEHSLRSIEELTKRIGDVSGDSLIHMTDVNQEIRNERRRHYEEQKGMSLDMKYSKRIR